MNLEKNKRKIQYIVPIICFLIGLAWVNYFYIGTLPRPRGGIGVDVGTCSAGVVNIKIKNLWATGIGANEIDIDRTSPEAEPNTPDTCCNTPLEPGVVGLYNDHTCGSGKNCTYRVTPPVGKTITITVDCR